MGSFVKCVSLPPTQASSQLLVSLAAHKTPREVWVHLCQLRHSQTECCGSLSLTVVAGGWGPAGRLRFQALRIALPHYHPSPLTLWSHLVSAAVSTWRRIWLNRAENWRIFKYFLLNQSLSDPFPLRFFQFRIIPFVTIWATPFHSGGHSSRTRNQWCQDYFNSLKSTVSIKSVNDRLQNLSRLGRNNLSMGDFNSQGRKKNGKKTKTKTKQGTR